MAVLRGLLQTTRIFTRDSSPKLSDLHILAKQMMTSNSKKMKMHTGSAMSSDRKEERLVWIDLEMTGLDIEKDRIIEIACLVTTGNLDMIAEGPHLVIHQPKEVMDAMGDWCRQHHGHSGLTKAVLKSDVSVAQAEQSVLTFVRQHTVKGQAPLAGNSIYMDKMFLQRYMPSLIEHLHYRIVDVSTVKELCRRWYPDKFRKAPEKALTHRALDDIRESIKELQYYRETIFSHTQ